MKADRDRPFDDDGRRWPAWVTWPLMKVEVRAVSLVYLILHFLYTWAFEPLGWHAAMVMSEVIWAGGFLWLLVALGVRWADRMGA